MELPGCYTQAPDLPSLEKNVQEAILAYLRTVEPEQLLSKFRRHLAGRGNRVTKLRLVPFERRIILWD